MNRAARRFEQRLRHPTGGFVSELRKRRDQTAYAEALRSQMEREANGQPIPGDVLERMTKEKAPDEMFQVGVTVRDTGKTVFLGPMMSEDAIRNIVAGVNKQIALGLRRDWTMADAYPMTPIQGVN